MIVFNICLVVLLIAALIQAQSTVCNTAKNGRCSGLRFAATDPSVRVESTIVKSQHHQRISYSLPVLTLKCAKKHFHRLSNHTTSCQVDHSQTFKPLDSSNRTRHSMVPAVVKSFDWDPLEDFESVICDLIDGLEDVLSVCNEVAPADNFLTQNYDGYKLIFEAEEIEAFQALEVINTVCGLVGDDFSNKYGGCSKKKSSLVTFDYITQPTPLLSPADPRCNQALHSCDVDVLCPVAFTTAFAHECGFFSYGDGFVSPSNCLISSGVDYANRPILRCTVPATTTNQYVITSIPHNDATIDREWHQTYLGNNVTLSPSTSKVFLAEGEAAVLYNPATCTLVLSTTNDIISQLSWRITYTINAALHSSTRSYWFLLSAIIVIGVCF